MTSNRDLSLLMVVLIAPQNPLVELLPAIQERGGELLEARSSTVGGRHVFSALIGGNWGTLARLETFLPSYAERLSGQLFMQRSDEAPQLALAEYRPYTAELVAPQQIDILSKVIAFFNGYGVTVLEMSKQLYQAHLSEAAMCNVQMILLVPTQQAPQVIREGFMDLCDHLSADGIFDPIKS